MFDPTISPIYDDVSKRLRKDGEFYVADIDNILPWGMNGLVFIFPTTYGEWHWSVVAGTDYITTAGHPRCVWTMSSFSDELGWATFPTKAKALNDALESIYVAGLTVIE